MYLKAIEVSEVKEASNGNLYKVVTFQELSEFAVLPGKGQTEVKTNATPHKRVLWNNQDGLFHSMEQNDVTFGTIKRLEVDEYEITNQQTGEVRRATSTTVVQFRGESDDSTAMRYGRKLRIGSPVINEESKANAAVKAVEVASIPA